MRNGHAGGPVEITPVRGLRRLTDFGVVVDAVIGALDFRDHWTPGERARHLQRAHDRLGAGIDETNFVEARHPRAQIFRVLNLRLRTHHVGRTETKLLLHRLDDLRKGMAVYQRSHVVGEIEAPHAFDICYVAPLTIRGVERVRLSQYGVPAAASWQHPERPLIERSAPGERLIVVSHRLSRGNISSAPLLCCRQGRSTPGAICRTSNPCLPTAIVARSV